MGSRYYFALSSILSLCSSTQGFSIPPLLEHGNGNDKIKYALKCEILHLMPFGAQIVFIIHICTPIPDISCFQAFFNYLEGLLLRQLIRNYIPTLVTEEISAIIIGKKVLKKSLGV